VTPLVVVLQDSTSLSATVAGPFTRLHPMRSYTYLKGGHHGNHWRRSRGGWARVATHTYLGARGSRRRMSSRGSKATAHSTRETAGAGLGCRRERVKAKASGRGELELAKRVVGALADLAGDGQPGDSGIAALTDLPIEGKVRRRRSMGVHCRLDERPAQMG